MLLFKVQPSRNLVPRVLSPLWLRDDKVLIICKKKCASASRYLILYYFKILKTFYDEIHILYNILYILLKSALKMQEMPFQRTNFQTIPDPHTIVLSLWPLLH